MKIISLESENLKRIKAVRIDPDGALVQITGRNGQGKTSVLDSLWWALSGTREVQSQPIRRGQERARVKLDLGEVVVTRTFTAQEDGGFTTALKVETAEGARYGKPQEVLDALVGDLSFDPLQFARQSAKAQFDALKALAPGVDFDALAKADEEDREARRVANKRAKELRTLADGIGLPAGAVPAKVDLAPFEAELARAGEHNALVERRRAGRQSAVEAIARLGEEIEALRAKIDAAIAAKEELETKLVEAEALPEPIDTAKVAADLAAARQANIHADRAASKAQHNADAQVEEDKAATLDKAITAREVEKQKAVAAAKMPVEGLAFGENCITLNGLPFDQASDAQQLRASIAIAGALNPTLRVIRVRDGSLLDEEGLAALGKYAEAHDLQVWVEVVSSGQSVGFVIEDGEVKGHAAPVSEPDGPDEVV